jgi:hypothetical protein
METVYSIVCAIANGAEASRNRRAKTAREPRHTNMAIRVATPEMHVVVAA